MQIQMHIIKIHFCGTQKISSDKDKVKIIKNVEIHGVHVSL